jgi:hypothetical protein
MKEIKDKEQIVRDVVNSFNDADELHKAYKNKMKFIIVEVFHEFGLWADGKDFDENDLAKWIDNFVEERFKPQE